MPPCITSQLVSSSRYSTSTVRCFSILTACYKARTLSAPDYNHNMVGRVPVLRPPSKASLYILYSTSSTARFMYCSLARLSRSGLSSSLFGNFQRCKTVHENSPTVHFNACCEECVLRYCMKNVCDGIT